jgi:5-methylcytosine-specific restriction endonuclease McrBC GTP-binding regulatory subunit McrB
LKDHDPTTRHVLVLDEINRCDTASVLGELLQLLEYRGRDVRLLSGRMFRFPRNVYIVGTMNSADRSIGRMDLALRRRFLWVDLTPNYEVLQTWLSRTGNNRSRFSADALRQCNALLSDRGIPPQQQVGHALFMVQTFGSETKEPADKPLLPETLRRIVKFSVVPYVAELCLMQFGRPDSELVRQVETTLLKCLTPSIDDQNGLDDDG